MAEREHAHPLVPDLADDLFAGTGEWYATYRPAYPQELLDDLIQQTPRTRGEQRRLVDLGCGPGTVCLRLQDRFDHVLAVDLEPDMIDTGTALARSAGVNNIEWQVSRAEDVDLPAGSIDLITIGNAFHRLNRPLIAAKAFRWLRQDGLLAEVGLSTGITSGDTPWQQVVLDVYRRWWAKAPNRPAAREPRDPTLATTEVLLREAGFVDVHKHEVEVAQMWTADEIVGYLFSTSHASRRIFGELADDFSADLTSALLAHDPMGEFRESLSAYTVTARRP